MLQTATRVYVTADIASQSTQHVKTMTHATTTRDIRRVLDPPTHLTTIRLRIVG